MRKLLPGVLIFAGLGINLLGTLPASAQNALPAVSCSSISLGQLGAFNGFVPSPNDAWHQDISNAPLDPNSTKIITTPGDLANRYLHPDFGSTAGGGAGIPYVVVDSANTPVVPFTNLDYAEQSDIAYYPLPSNMPIEGSPGDCPADENDRHAIVIDRNSCVIYELYQAGSCSSSTTLWSASNGAMWDMLSVENRPFGYTSVDAAGLSVFAGLVRYDEIQAGAINHALRFTANHTKNDANDGYFTAPAVHAAGSLWGTDNIMGMRIRLSASFDISGFSPTNQIILTAMKKYGMILADNGSDMFFQGTPDARWNDDDLDRLKTVPSSAFEVVQMNPVYDSESAPKGAAPVISSFTATPSVAYSGQPVVLQSVSNGSYSYIDKAGFTRGTVTVYPTATTTYTLTSRNAYDTASATVTVTVQSTVPPTLGFVSIPDQTFSLIPMAVSATSNSTGAITYSVLSGPAILAGNLLTMTGLGTVTLQASQAAAGSFAAATATTSFVVNGTIPTLVFAQIPDQVLGGLPLTLSATSNSTGAITYAVVSGPATVAGNVLTLSGSGRVTVIASQASAGTFASTASTVSFNVSASANNLAFNPILNQIFSTAPITVLATSNSTGAITYSVLSGPATMAGNVVTLTGTGLVTLQAVQAAVGNFSAGTATTSFTVSGVPPLLVFATIPDQVLGGSPLTLSATSNSAGAISYSVVSGAASVAGNRLTLNGTGTVTVQASQAASGTFAAGSATLSFNVAGSSVLLAFATIPDQIFSGTPITVSATSNSSGAITYSVLSGPATIAGNVLTLTGLGTVALQANQAAAGIYGTGVATMNFRVSGVTPTLVFPSLPDQSMGSVPLTLAASSNSTGAISYSVASGPATVSGNRLTLTGTGNVTVTASQAAIGTFAAASATMSFNVLANTNNLMFVPIPDQTFSTTPITVATTSSSNGATTYLLVGGPAWLVGNVVTLTGVGTVTLQANQAASGNFAAGTATTNFLVNGVVPMLVLAPIPDQMLGGAPLALSAISNSPGAISYSVVAGAAGVAGNQLTLNGAGTVTVKASQAASGTFAATSATVSFNVSGSAVLLAFATIPDQTFSSTPITVSATSNSTGTITYSVLSGPAAIAGNALTLTGLGTVVVQANQAAAGIYAAGIASMSFRVNGAIPNLVFPAVPDQSLGGAPLTLAATSNSTGAISYSVVSGPATVSGNHLTLNGTGTVTVMATQAALGTFAAASATVSFNVLANANNLVFAPIADLTFSATPITVAATSISTGAITYSVVSGPATVAGNVVTLTGLGTVTLQANQAAAGNYAAGVATTSFRVSGVVPNLVFPSLPDQSLSSTPLLLSASSNSTGAITYSVASGPATVSGNRLTLTGTGNVTVTASQAAIGTFATASVTISFNVLANANNLVFAAIADQTFGALPFSVSATSNSTGAITYAVVSGPATIAGNIVTLTGTGTVTLQATQAALGNYAAGTATISFQVNGLLPTLVLSAIPDQVLGGAPVGLSATSNSSGAITYSVVSGPAAVAGNTLTLNGTGTVTVRASQAAAGTFSATSATVSFNVSGSAVLLVFATVPDQTFSGTPILLSATSNSAGAITYSVLSGPAILAGNALTLTGLGTVAVQANQAAAGIYSAGVASMSFRVSGVVPNLVFPSLPDQNLGSTPLVLSASSNSTGSISYSVVSGPATVSGNLLTLNGTGKVTVTASQAAIGTFATAAVTISFNVLANTNNLVFAPIADQTFGALPFAVSATSNSTGAITYGVSSGPATIAGNIVTLTGTGTVTLQATQAALGNYAAGTATISFQVSGVLPSLVFIPIPDQVLGGAPVGLSATSNSSGAITYSVVSGPAAVAGNTLTLNGTGTVTVRASQAAAGTFAATSATVSFNVSGSAVLLVFATVPDQTFSGTPILLSATSNSAGAITYSVLSGPAILAGNALTLTGLGTVAVQANQAAAGIYSAGVASMSFRVSGVVPNLVFPSLPDQNLGSTPLLLSASSNSTGSISYSVASGPATVSGNLLTLNGTGKVTVTASQAAIGTFAAAAGTISFNVSANANSLAFVSIPDQSFGGAPIPVSATSNSTGAITYAVVSGPATIAGNLVTLTGIGTVTLQASQAAAGSYSAGIATTSFVVAGVLPSLVFAAIPDQTLGGSPLSLLATSNSSGAITYSVVSGSASVAVDRLTLNGAGTVTVRASQAASGTFASASATVSFNVTGSPVLLAFMTIPDQTFRTTPITVQATSNSTGAITYSVLSGPAILAGNALTLTGVGIVSVQASQAASGTYAAGVASMSFQVNGVLPSLVFPTLPDQLLSTTPLTLSASSNSPGAISYSVAGPATVSANRLNLNGTGRVTVTASQAAVDTFAAALASISFNISANANNLAFNLIPDQTAGSAPITVAAVSNSTAAITYSVVGGPAVTSGNVVSFTGPGVVILQATQASNLDYGPATATTSFQVLPIVPLLAISNVGPQVVSPSPLLLSAFSSSAAPMVWAVLGGPATISGNALTLIGAGDVLVQVSQAAFGNYSAAVATLSFPARDFVLDEVAPLKVAQGNKVSTPVLLAGLNGFAGQVNFSCTVPEAMGPATCSIDQVMLRGDGTKATGTLTITTVLPASADARHGAVKTTVEGGSALAVLLLPFGFRRKRRSLVWLALLLVSVASVAVTGCGVGQPTTAGKGTFQVELTAVSVPISHSTNVEVLVY